MSSSLLLEAILIIGDPPRSRPQSLKWNPILYRRVPRGFAENRRFIRCSSHLALKPTNTSRYCSDFSEGEGSPWGGFIAKVFETLELLKKPAIAALLVGVLLTADGAIAASGGRMGGRAFSSSSSSSSSSHSRSYSALPGSGFSVPYYAPSPFGATGGFYVGPAVGVGSGAGSGFFFLLMGFAAFVLLSGFLSDRSDDGSVLTATQKTSVLKLQVGLLGIARSFQKDLDKIAETANTSTPEGLNYVLTETSLALLRHPDCCILAYSSVDIKRSVEDGEKRFNQLSIEERGKFDEETLVNVNNIKRQKTTSYCSRTFNNEYIVITIIVAAEGVHKLPVINSSADLKAALQKLGSIPASKTMLTSSNPTFSSFPYNRRIHLVVPSHTSRCHRISMIAVEVLWTPQNENDTLTERELLEDYPLLRPL
ncbi:hypothetical protein KSP40_PGU018690 [Platanthera guangdongensis]|uniref:Uncharacterized protein n=1 Tax=Platanthera guangdongensis TaxID=2320717 RepID=A0ABR2MI11_9ASPA